MSEEMFRNGIDGSTGRYLPGPRTDFDLARQVHEGYLTPAELRNRQWWVERYGIDDPLRAPVEKVDPARIASAGWGILYGSDVTPEMREALEPLVEHRRASAGSLFKEYESVAGQSKDDFLEAHKAPPGPADPKYIPYYLLIVGDPRTIPFRFQYELDVQYAVGRIWFDRADDYRNYAQSVVRTETQPPPRPKRLTFFGPSNPDDQATLRTSRDLIAPLAETLKDDWKGWEVQTILGAEASKERLVSVLGGKETPSLLFTASHGVAFPMGDPRQLAHQGALLCQDWPGPVEGRGEVPPGVYFSADDLAGEASLQGMIAVHFACFGGGTPEEDGFWEGPLGRPPRIAPYPFLARLPQRLLSHPGGGALAVISHTDRAWTTSFSWSEQAQPQIFENLLCRLLKGFPVGSAMEYVNQRHAELSVQVSHHWEDRRSMVPVSRELLSRVWRANSDARNFVVFGDPAVRLAWTGTGT